MTRRPQALIVEDDATERRRVTELVQGLGFQVHATDSPLEAEAWIQTEEGFYSVAVIDWDMRKSRDSDEAPTSRVVLEQLANRSPWTRTLVFAGHLGQLDVQEQIHDAHVGALLQDKTAGEDRLRRRVRRLLQPRFGDLEVDAGRVRHRPSGQMTPNEVGLHLLVSHPHWVPINSSDERLRAMIKRFRSWLRDVDSAVAVSVSWGTGRYSLKARDDAHR